jgi:hypothetical protein
MWRRRSADSQTSTKMNEKETANAGLPNHHLNSYIYYTTSTKNSPQKEPLQANILPPQPRTTCFPFSPKQLAEKDNLWQYVILHPQNMP